MDPARMFRESLTSRPELENSQGQKATLQGREALVRSALETGHLCVRRTCPQRAFPHRNVSLGQCRAHSFEASRRS